MKRFIALVIVLALAVILIPGLNPAKAEIPSTSVDGGLGPTDTSMIDGTVVPKGGPTQTVSNNITIIVNGKAVTSDVAPYILENRTMVPYRFIAEALGSKVSWEEATKKVTAVKGTSTVELYVDQNYIMVNGVQKNIDVAPTIKDGRTMIPIRFLSEALGYKVEWVGSTQTVYINSQAQQQVQEKYYDTTGLFNEDGTVKNIDPSQAAGRIVKAGNGGFGVDKTLATPIDWVETK